jgi:hypothetical protein
MTMFITKYGDISGQLPVVTGRLFWVAPAASYTLNGKSYVASDGQDGLDPRRAFLTLDYAVGKCTANVGDVIVLLPGAHSWATTVAADVAGITITGLGDNSPGRPESRSSRSGVKNRTQVTTTAAAAIFTVTAADVEIANLYIVPAAGYGGIAPSALADRLYVHDCTFYTATATNTATMGIDVTYGVTAAHLDDLVVRNCLFINSDANGPGVRLAATTYDAVIENCTFRLVGDTAWDDAIEITVICLGTLIRDCDFMERVSGTVITDCIDNAAATTDGCTTVLRCMFPVGANGLTNANVADNQCAENYLMQAAANVGGTLILCT